MAYGLLAAPVAAEAQAAGKVYRVGMLETRSATLNAANVDAFRVGMRALAAGRLTSCPCPHLFA